MISSFFNQRFNKMHFREKKGKSFAVLSSISFNAYTDEISDNLNLGSSVIPFWHNAPKNHKQNLNIK